MFSAGLQHLCVVVARHAQGHADPVVAVVFHAFPSLCEHSLSSMQWMALCFLFGIKVFCSVLV